MLVQKQNPQRCGVMLPFRYHHEKLVIFFKQHVLERLISLILYDNILLTVTIFST